jgi:uncharacterized protein involved in outer membrane biogenesis
MVALVVAPFFISIEKYKPQIIAKLEKALDRKVEIKSKLELRVFPKIKLIARNIIIHNPNEGLFASETFGIIPAIKTEVAFLPLFKKQIYLTKFQVKGPQFTFETDAEGNRNFLFTQREEFSAEEGVIEEVAPSAIDNKDYFVKKYEFSGGKIAIERGKANIKFPEHEAILKEIYFNAENKGLKGKLSFKSLFSIGEQEFKLVGDVSDNEDFAVQIDTELSSDYLYIQSNISIPQQVGEEALNVELNASTISIQKLLQGLGVAYSQEVFDLNNPLDIKTKLTLNREQLKVDKLDIALNSITVNNALIIGLKNKDLSGHSQIKIPDTQALYSIFSRGAIKNIQIGSVLDIIADYQYRDDIIKFENINITSFDDIIQSEVIISLKEKMDVAAKIYAANINVKDYISSEEEPAHAEIPSQPSSNKNAVETSNIAEERRLFNWSSNKFNLGFLDRVNAKIVLEGKDFAYNSFAIKEIKAAMQIVDGQAIADISQVELASGGEVSNKLQITKQSENGLLITNNTQFKDAQTHEFIEEISAFQRFSGKLKGDAKLNSKGESIKEVVANLKGNIMLNVVDGAIENVDIEDIMSNPKTTIDTIKSGRSEKALKLDVAAANLSIAKGVILPNSNVLVQSGSVQISAIGAIDLITEKIKATLEPKIKDFVVPINITGQLVNYKYELDYKELARREVEKAKKRAVERAKRRAAFEAAEAARKAEEEKKRIERKLKDKLELELLNNLQSQPLQ